MPDDDLAAVVAAALRAEADPDRAAAMQAYMKDVAPFLGVPTPTRRAVTMPTVRAARFDDGAALLTAAERVWAAGMREDAYAATDLLERHHRLLTVDHLDRLRALVVAGGWWDTTDALAKVANLAGRRQVEVDRAMEDWLEDDDGWVRRVALLHQLGRRDAVDLDRLFRYSLRHADDRWFFTRKAIGWALRDASYAHPRAVEDFVDANQDRLSPLTVREAMKAIRRGR